MPTLDIEPTITPNELAKQYGWSSRALRRKARELGACHVLGRTMVLTKGDVDALLEALRPRPLAPQPAVPERIIAVSNSDYDALFRLRKKLEREGVWRGPRYSRRGP